jgi:hypothetical protein
VAATSKRSIMPRSTSTHVSIVEQIAMAIATADGTRFEDDPKRFNRLALAALKPVARPTEAMVDAAHEAVRFAEHWAVNSRRDFRKGVQAMILAAMNEKADCLPLMIGA